MSLPRGVRGQVNFVLLVSLLCLLPAGCGGPAGAGPAEITSFEPPSGVLQSGEPASASVRVANRGPDTKTFWVGYSFRDG